MSKTHPPYELPIKLPFLKFGEDVRVRDFIDTLLQMIDRSCVPHNRLSVLAPVRLGFLCDDVEDNECTFVYSPALMGRNLNLHNTDDALYIMNVILEQWNIKYQKQYSTQTDMPGRYFVSSWVDICDNWNLGAQNVYDEWAAKRLKLKIGEEVHVTGGVSSIKKM